LLTDKMLWKTTRFYIDLATPKVMGIVNVTPDSFSDGSQHANLTSALKHCELLLKQGAHILDIGGESTRPGAQPVSVEEELQRVVPVVKEAVRFNVPISVDTYKPQVMQAALDAGSDIINDIWALRQKGALDVVSTHTGCGVCLMHMHAQPQHMQMHPMEGLAIPAVIAFLQERAQALMESGVSKERIALDPGVGFGKTVAQNFELLAHQKQLSSLGYPLLVGWSRKSSLGAVTGCDLGERLVPSVAAALLAVERGAQMVRVHDVEATVQALTIWQYARSSTRTLRE
jgi:dihydropteroate synthase